MTILTVEQKKEKYGIDLLEWYFHIQRDLPWRKNHDPYRIWVSEIMLQQTRVDTVIPYYNTFMEKFPTVRALAEAPEDEVLKCWEGLGYYSRARNLQAGARMVMEQYNGQVPTNVEEVAKLKGVGPYTCGAIMSIAYNEPIPAVDGNVMRVLSRFFLLEDDIAKASTRTNIEKLVVTMIPEGKARYFNQALMELGALICSPKSPSCLICPVMEHCEARIQGRELEIPIKTKAKKARVEHRVAAIVEGTGENEGKILIRQRPAEGLLAGMWELPHVLIDESSASPLFISEPKEQPVLGEAISSAIYTDQKLLVRPYEWYSDEEHIFSHIRWKMRFYKADMDESSLVSQIEGNSEAAQMHSDQINSAQWNPEHQVAEQSEQYTSNAVLEREYRFISEADMKTLPFPNLFLKVIQQYWVQKGE
ncbi:MAG: A/G-specific adenine glycosylase [Candidatus Pristimantibacillus lignocellulolyticus]|uniref:Adenine DNA glycosylase n=1 Tax=Candidatus Pristimantibacillus lignocellulolyticus TaxID=2994561 RepID=A0A9J6ZFS7_9BACL|nr:MAG: A/G-specific adenine glycosylase [Candidatus Pristimantibacillus lignocellulolyticus]